MRTPHVVELLNCDTFPTCEVGSKAHTLARIMKCGLLVPQGFCVTCRAFQEVLDINHITPLLTLLDSNHPNDTERTLGDIRQRIEQATWNRALAEAICEAYAEMRPCTTSVGKPRSLIVRSSSGTEDLAASMAAGQYLSLPDIKGDTALLDAIKSVWASQFTTSAYHYRRLKSLPLNAADMAVLVQEMIQSNTSGVVYTADVDNSDAYTMLVEGAPPTHVVTGRGVSGRWYIDKRSALVSKEVRFSQDAGSLNSHQLKELITAALRVERLFNAPVDIEWIISSDTDVAILQARALHFDQPRSDLRLILRATDARSRSGKIRAACRNPQLSPRVITHAAFQAFKSNNRALPAEAVEVVSAALTQMTLEGAITVRSAYSSALNSADMLPVGGPFRDSDLALEFVYKYWNFVLSARLDDYSADVALLMHRFCSPFASAVVTGSVYNGTECVVVEALYGYLDGLETAAHDTYVLTSEALPELLLRHTPAKPIGVFSVGGGFSAVPGELVDRPVLNNEVLGAIAVKARDVLAEVGGGRIEVLVLADVQTAIEDDSAIVVWQVDPLQQPLTWSPPVVLTRDDGRVNAIERGRLVLIRGWSDVEHLKAVRRGEPWIALVDLSAESLRDTRLVNALAEVLRDLKLSVVLQGALLSHVAGTFRDFGLKLYGLSDAVLELNNGTPVAVSRGERLHEEGGRE